MRVVNLKFDEKVRNNKSHRISVVISTRDRSKDLIDLLLTILSQRYTPFEVIIIDDSHTRSTEQVVDSFSLKFKTINCDFKYIKGIREGLTAARNLGIKVSKGDIILFLDDDTLLEDSVLLAFTTFLIANQNALGVQGQIHESSIKYSHNIKRRIENAICKAFMLTYYEQNKLAVRRSGTSIVPYFFPLTKEINGQRLDGCCMCYRRGVFHKLFFDTNLVRWGCLEDLDFSYRLYKKHPGTLYAIPSARILHKKSMESRLPSKILINMMIVYWFYIFFKDVFEDSIVNLIAFLWALFGNLTINIGVLILKSKPKYQWRELVYLVNSYFYALRHLREIKRRNLEFFNDQLKEKS